VNQYGNSTVQTILSASATTEFQGYYGEKVGWKQSLKNGNQAGTQMNISSTRATKGSLSVGGKINYADYYPNPTTSSVAGGQYHANGWFPYPGIPSEAKANSKALSKFVSRAIKAQTAVSGGVFLGELGETLRLIKNPLRGFRAAIGRYGKAAKKISHSARSQRRRAETIHRANKNLSETWLEHSFGWAPLVNDIDDAMRHLAFLTTGVSRPPYEVVKGFAEEEKSASYHTSGLSDGAYWRTRLRKTTTDKLSVKYLGMVSAEQFNQISARSLGLGLRDFAPTVWELIPYSFLVDYFTNVGDMIQASSFSSSNLSWVMKWVVRETTYESLYHAADSWNPESYDIYCSATPATLTVKTITRIPYVGSLVPSFRLEMPGANSLKWLNIGALVHLRS
jgi:hypothetical protein